MSAEFLTVAFDDITDPRIDRHKRYSISEIMLLCVVAVISGADSWNAIAKFGEMKKEWLRKYLPYKHGVPSHDTIGRVMSLLKPDELVKGYTLFIEALFNIPEKEVIAIDGKALRRSFDNASGQKMIHTLNAWAVNRGVCLASLPVDKKSNEITSVPEILELIDIKGATVTVDALNTQKNIAKKIKHEGGEYALAVKGNQKKLHEEAQEAFLGKEITLEEDFRYYETNNSGHGRVEKRQYYCTPIKNNGVAKDWIGAVAFGKVISEVTSEKGISCEERLFLLSFDDVKEFSETVRMHWGVENSLHWVLDVTFKEDNSRVRKDNAPNNFSLIRKLAIALLKLGDDSKDSIPIRRHKAAWNSDYLDKILRR